MPRRGFEPWKSEVQLRAGKTDVRHDANSEVWCERHDAIDRGVDVENFDRSRVVAGEERTFRLVVVEDFPRRISKDRGVMQDIGNANRLRILRIDRELDGAIDE